MSWWRGIYRNRVRVACSTSSTDWQIIATDSTGYATYGDLLAAGKKPFPGDNNDFPTGVPCCLIRCDGSSQADGDAVNIKTNTIATPAASDLGDDLISGSGQTLVLEGVGVWALWCKKKTAGNVVQATGMF